MRRADRLFQIVQCLHHQRSVTARQLAETLAVSERTIYRDIQDLVLSGIPITGEAGVGYRLMKGFHLPPIMFNEEELCALLLGARMVQAWSDKGLSDAARRAMAKIERVVPDKLKPELERQELIVPDFPTSDCVSDQLAIIRAAVKSKTKIHFSYTRADGEASVRCTHPLGLFYWGKIWTLVAWCELRDDFRHFRLDRMDNISSLEEHFQSLPGRTLPDFLAGCCSDLE